MKPQEQKMVGNQSQTVWRLDSEHTSVEFSIKKLLFVTVKGCLADLDGSIVLHENSISGSSVQVIIRAASIDTGNKRRDAHLRSADFLEADSYPNIQFQSSQVGRGKDRDTLSIKGTLTIRDKSKDVELAVTEVDRSRSPGGEEVIYYVAETEIDRYDFGITAWRGVIGPRLKVVINVQANRES